MDDRVAEILQNHIKTAERQLALIRDGAPFDGVTAPIPEREADLVALIHKWHAELKRHEDRKRAQGS